MNQSLREKNVVTLPVNQEPVSGADSIRSLVYDVRTCIQDAQNAALQYALRIGKDLIELKAICKRDGIAFGSLFPASDAEHNDPNKLPFNRQSGYKLIAIAEHELLANVSQVRHALPSDWGSLYQLARLPAPKLKKLIDSGDVTPTLSRAAATQLAKENTVPTSKTKNPKTQQAKATQTKREIARADLIACLAQLKKETQIDELREIAAELGFVISIRSKK